MDTYNDKELETAFVQTRLDAGLTFDDAWAAWVDFHSRILFIASQPFLPLYMHSKELTLAQRAQMRREARAALGKHVRTGDVTNLATAAEFLGVVAPSREPPFSEELMELGNELALVLKSREAGNPEPPMPNLEAFATKFRLACPGTAAARAAEATPERLAQMFVIYVEEHTLGDLPFESLVRMFAGLLDEYVRHDREVPHTDRDFLKFLDARGDVE